MHHVINGLEQDNLVSREVDAKDRRRQLLMLTSKGKRKIKKAHEARLSYLKELAAEIDISDLAVAASTLDAMRNESWQRF